MEIRYEFQDHHDIKDIDYSFELFKWKNLPLRDT